MSDPHLTNWLFLLPAFLLGATIERGAGALSRLAQCFLALSASSRLSKAKAVA